MSRRAILLAAAVLPLPLVVLLTSIFEGSLALDGFDEVLLGFGVIIGVVIAFLVECRCLVPAARPMNGWQTLFLAVLFPGLLLLLIPISNALDERIGARITAHSLAGSLWMISFALTLLISLVLLILGIVRLVRELLARRGQGVA